MDAERSALLSQFQETLQTQPLDVDLLLAQGRQLIEIDCAQALLDLLALPAPPDAFCPPDLHLLEAEARMAIGDLQGAIICLEAAQNAFSDAGRPDGEVRSLLLTAQIHHRREDLEVARLYTDEAVELLRRHPTLDPQTQAHAYLSLARLAPDIGQLGRGLQLGQDALKFYSIARYPPGQLDAALLISSNARQLGRYQLAQAHLTLAKRWLPHLPNRAAAQARIDNGEAHQLWSQGNFRQAEEILRRAVVEADATPQSKFRIYQRLILANVLRAQARYDEAEAMYTETDAVIAETNFTLFHAWVTVNWGWLHLLRGEFAAARRAFFQVLETADPGQAASFNVFLAVLYALTGRLADAEGLLRRSLHFYQTSGDELSIFALRVHLAYVYLQSGQIDRAEEEISLALNWAAHWNIDYFPHWWHPSIVATVCAHAFVAEIHPSLAERMLVNRLGEAALPVLRRLEIRSSPALRRRVEDVLSLLNTLPLAHITEIEDEPVRQVLSELFVSGRLQQQKLPELARLLSTTRQSDKANPVLLASFGLYVHGSTRREIAERLHRTEDRIRNYITDIYERFGIEGTNGPRRARYLHLRRLAVEAGYVGETGS
ncbi:MAG: hypothetical protein KF893_14100 [Caldilineaceae bacterium]|nr:hypothetical protein [Caldilineaceae bacterium]